nr:MAG TPA_asm: hypothetical protein [Caudoviricetes sp.]
MDALLLLLLPLLFTLAKDDEPDASGDRSHQLEVNLVEELAICAALNL